jgi:multicomponent Na+:H+ antiporter subunit D
VALLLAGVFAELGIYGVARVHWTAFAPVMAGHEGDLRALLVALGAVTAVVGAVQCAAQHHLKRMLAFATIAQVGLFLIAAGLLTADAVAGLAIWIVGDGLVKAALFTAVAIVQHRTDSVSERELHAVARPLWATGALMTAAALALATLPPFGPWLGKALVEDAASALPGYGWVAPLMVLVSALVGGTILRVVARVFLGWGRPAPDDPAARAGHDESEEWGGAERTSPLVWGPALALLAAGLAWGLLPGLPEVAGRAAHRFTDTRAYVDAVLGGHRVAAPPVRVHVQPVTYLYGAASVLGALAVAWLSLTGLLPAPRAGRRALGALRALHSGRIGDYAAWLAAGAALLTAISALAVS